MRRTIVFDLDGTLADTSADLIAAANACFQRLGHGDMLDPALDASTAFQGGRAMLRLGFERLGEATEALVDAQYHQLLAAYGEAIDVHTTLYPGAVDAIEALRKRGDGVAICTNKPEGLAETLMQRLGVRDLFGVLIGADTLPVRKPDPLPYIEAVRRVDGALSRSLLIGDTVTDRETSRAAGVASVLVTFGPDGRSVEELAPEGLLDHYNELLAVLEALLPTQLT